MMWLRNEMNKGEADPELLLEIIKQTCSTLVCNGSVNSSASYMLAV